MRMADACEHVTEERHKELRQDTVLNARKPNATALETILKFRVLLRLIDDCLGICESCKDHPDVWQQTLFFLNRGTRPENL